MRIARKKSIECLNDTLNSRNEYLLKPFLLNGMLSVKFSEKLKKTFALIIIIIIIAILEV